MLSFVNDDAVFDLMFMIEDAVFNRIPGVCFGVVVAGPLDNAREYPEIAALLDAQTAALRQRFAEVDAREHPGILPYREAFRGLGLNPNKFLSSIEALARRVQKGSELPRINPVVDLSTAISLKYLIALGAHDITKTTGNFEVRLARPGDSFLPIGEPFEETPEAGEVVYARGSSISTRRWIWRQSEHCKIDPSSRMIFFPLDGFRNSNETALLAARDELADHVLSIFGCNVRKGFLTRENPVMHW